jgi:hypothetical protein
MLNLKHYATVARPCDKICDKKARGDDPTFDPTKENEPHEGHGTTGEQFPFVPRSQSRTPESPVAHNFTLLGGKSKPTLRYSHEFCLGPRAFHDARS